jgi:hypothetical protein
MHPSHAPPPLIHACVCDVCVCVALARSSWAGGPCSLGVGQVASEIKTLSLLAHENIVKFVDRYTRAGSVGCT